MVLRQLTKEQAKEEVKKLVDKYNRILESGSIKRYKEEDTKAEFIEPLFEALGWDVRNIENDDEVVREEKISKGRVDYSFRINGIPKFFLEAKALKEDLDNIKFVEQAINYSWHKGCTWAVLTDFEAIKIFNAEWKSANPLQAQFGQTLPCQLFLEKFDTLWLLSRESFEKKLLDAEAEKWGKKVKKIPVDKLLLADLTKFRDLLNKNILKNNSSKNISGDELDEAVQRIIDRLIFIRTLEDKELEAPMLQSVIREDLNKRVYKKLNLIFRKIDEIYNSKLFTPHLCEDLDIDDEVLAKIINGLFNTSDNTVHYDFSAIDADVLGNIYEQYLGHILKKTDKRAKLAEGKAHRKEQGIYYTPTYVVDYIVKNTVGELAKDKKFDLKNIKILDPACGSGSFLMKAFDYLVTLDKKKNGEDQTKLDLTGASASYGRKVEILKNNIFGVDLDPKAVEIAQLNLLLKAAEKKHRLPTLQENIRVGNSLIDDPAVAGERAFKWEEQFKEIISNGGFDVVIGNPPYFNLRTNVIYQKYFQEKDSDLFSGQDDIFYYFIKKAITLLKDNGLMSFIVSRYYLESVGAKKLRGYILNNCEIICIIDFGNNQVFEDANILTSIIILKKHKKKTEFYFYKIKDKSNIQETMLRINKNVKSPNLDIIKISQSKLSNNPWIAVPDEYANVMKKIKQDSNLLGDISKIGRGIQSGLNDIFVVNDEIISEFKLEKKLLRNYAKTKDIKSYIIKRSGLKVIKLLFEDNIEEYPNTKKYLESHKQELKNRYEAKKGICKWYSLSVLRSMDIFDVQKEKIITPIYSTTNKFGFDSASDDENYFTLSDTIAIQLKNDKYNLKTILAILNSKLMNFYFRKNTKLKRDNYCEYITESLQKIPVKQNSASDKKIILLVDKILIANKHLLEIKDKQTDSKAQLEKEIQKIDNEIDEEVYKLYGITEEEKKIIEDSLK